MLCSHVVLSALWLQALCKVNRCLLAIDPDEQERFNVILMSHNHAHVGVRLINSINHHGKWVLPQTLIHGCTSNNCPFYSTVGLIFRQKLSHSLQNNYLLHQWVFLRIKLLGCTETQPYYYYCRVPVCSIMELSSFTQHHAFHAETLSIVLNSHFIVSCPRLNPWCIFHSMV